MPRMNGMDASGRSGAGSGDEDPGFDGSQNRRIHPCDAQGRSDGYLLKDSTHSELLAAVRHVLSGKHYISPGISDKVLDGYFGGKKDTENPYVLGNPDCQRTRDSEADCEGYKNKEIADDLCISVKTVEKHRANLMEKLNLHNVQALTTFAIERGLVSKEWWGIRRWGGGEIKFRSKKIQVKGDTIIELCSWQ